MSIKKQRVTHTIDPRISILLSQLCKNSAFRGRFHGMTASATIEKLIVSAAKEELDLDMNDFYVETRDGEQNWFIEVGE